MKVKQLIKELKELERQYGNIDVSITDGYESSIYEGAFSVNYYQYQGFQCIDIGVGGTKTDKED